MPDPATADVLRAAREKITPEGAWTQGVLARAKNGSPIRPTVTRAVCWCAIGAVESVTYDLWAINTLYIVGGFDDLAHWNDAPGRTQAEVLALFDRAIAAAEAHTSGGEG